MMKLAFAALVAISFSSCNTMIGVGRDFRQLGQGLEYKAHGKNFDGSESTPQDTLPTY
ncbi:putative small secreted protein [Haloferula luteola]|uniref:Putative small secreted protein n=1 Tax=Haloferula luteola TaxID=595692 RepID=A0A840V3H3_9BACT|nr:hypothetical protein [Haloferula luteola]MBB5352532.1 putative small secreted protein [Haloferula luteola]